jgi:hypothetical protein
MGIEHTTESSSWLWTGGHYGDDSPMPRFTPQDIGMRSFPAKGAQIPTINMMDLAEVTLKDTQVSARGAKSCQVRGQDGQKISFALGTASDPVTTPFGATSYNEGEGGRKTVEFSLTPEQDKAWLAFDHWAVEYLAKHSFRLFKKILTEDAVRENYRSPVTRKEGYRPHLRCKVNTDGAHAVRVWDVDRQRVALPEDLRETELIAKIFFSHCWMMSKEFGFVFQVTDLQLRSSSAECPFEEAGAFGGA